MEAGENILAAELLAALLVLDRNPQVAQLKAAKVPQHTIDALYPKVFEDLVPGLIDYLGEYDLAAFLDEAEWSIHADSTNSLLRDVSFDMSALSKQEHERFNQSPEQELLHDHILTGLKGRVAEIRTQVMIDSLWYARWFMLRIEDSGAFEHVQDHFIEIVQWLLPDLLERVGFEIEAGR